MTRTAVVRNADSRRQLEAYLPGNYKIVDEITEPVMGWTQYGTTVSHKVLRKTVFVIEGEDNAGWTLDGYVIPRLASGMIYATEGSL